MGKVYRPAGVNTKLVLVPGSPVHAVRVVKEIVGVQHIIAQVFIKGAMKTVGAGFCDQRHLRARRTAFVRPVVGRGHTKLLHGIQGDGQHGCEGVSINLVIHIDAVQGEIALVAAGSVYRAAARIVILIDVGAVACIGDAVLEAQQIGHVAAFQGQRLHLCFVKGVP